MTVSGPGLPKAAPAAPTEQKPEWRVIAKHASTILIGQIAVMAFGIADTVIAGRYADGALAALSVGTAIYISVYVSLMGVVQALLPVFAQLHGAQRYDALGQSFRQSLYLSLVLIAIGMVVMLNPGPLLQWAQVPQAMQSDIERYLAVLSYALAPSILFRLYASLNQSLGHPKLVTWLQVGALAVKVPLSVGLVFGVGGLPELGLVGCAWASFVVNWLIVGVAVIMLLTQSIYRPLKLWRKPEAIDWAVQKQFARTGVPGGLAYLVEITSFTLMALFIARLGIHTAAAHQIASNMAGALYMVPLSLAVASSARVSFWLGAGHAVLARHAALCGLAMTGLVAVLLASITALAAYPLAALYSPNAQVVAVAASLLLWVAAYHVMDALQAVSAFLLRCYGVTLLPVAIYGVVLWAGGLWGGYLLAFEGLGPWPAMHSAHAFWMTGALALALVALSFIALLLYALRARR